MQLDANGVAQIPCPQGKVIRVLCVQALWTTAGAGDQAKVGFQTGVNADVLVSCSDPSGGTEVSFCAFIGASPTLGAVGLGDQSCFPLPDIAWDINITVAATAVAGVIGVGNVIYERFNDY